MYFLHWQIVICTYKTKASTVYHLFGNMSCVCKQISQSMIVPFLDKEDLYRTTIQFIMFAEFQKHMLSLQQLAQSERQQTTKVSSLTEFEGSFMNKTP